MFIDTHIPASFEDGNSKPLFLLLSKPLKGEKCSNITWLQNCHNDSDVVECCAKNFNSVIFIDDGCVSKYPICGNQISQSDIEINEQGVHSILKSSKPHYGSVPDSFSPALLGFFAKDIAPILTTFFHHYFDSDCAPNDCKCANVVHAFKEGDKKALF